MQGRSTKAKRPVSTGRLTSLPKRYHFYLRTLPKSYKPGWPI
jgi:hypothetical protein